MVYVILILIFIIIGSNAYKNAKNTEQIAEQLGRLLCLIGKVGNEVTMLRDRVSKLEEENGLLHLRIKYLKLKEDENEQHK